MTASPSKLVTAAAGRRDAYQVPIALAEASLLACHVTDFYIPDAFVPLLLCLGARGHRLLRRNIPLLPSRLVHSSRRLALRKTASTLIPRLRGPLQSDQDPISFSSLSQARRHHAGLLLYAGYAYRAFTSEPRTARKRGLIQYHPHIRDSAAILRADAKRYPFLSNAIEHLRRDELDRTNFPELEIADLVICNSTFTASTCLSLGIDPAKLQVIAYGIDPLPIPTHSEKCASLCRFLFVGTGVQRKGLHHLLLAWKQASLRHSQLTIVSRKIDPEIRSAIDPGGNVFWLDAVSNQDLEQLFFQSDVFVLPSLVEGFGYVYLEAMARGCFCIGTANTGLPEIATPDSASVISAGDIEQLVAALQAAEDSYYRVAFDRSMIAAAGVQRNWAHFRSDVVAAVLEHLSP